MFRDSSDGRRVASPELLPRSGVLPHSNCSPAVQPVLHRREADMGHISMATRDELVVALAGRYGSSSRQHRGRILDEFVAVSGFHRKHAMRLLRAGRSGQGAGPRPARRIYSEAVRVALIVIWEAADRVCGKRFAAIGCRSWWKRWNGTVISNLHRMCAPVRCR